MRRLTICLWGPTKTFKTSFALQMPQPIHYFNLNYGLEGVLEYSAADPSRGGEFVLYNYPLPVFGEPGACVELLEKFKREYQRAISTIKTGTVVIDTATELDDLAQIATLEKLRAHKYHDKNADDFMPVGFDYGPRNTLMRSVILAPLHQKDLNGVFIYKSKDEYQGKDRTGNLTLDGWKHAMGEAQVTIRTSRSGPAVLYNCRLGPELNARCEGLELAELSYEFLESVLDV